MANRVTKSVLQSVPLVAFAALSVAAQQPAAPTRHPGDSSYAPKVGQDAPAFALSGATRFGVLKDSVRLTDYRGQIVVLAFFPKARTKG